MSRLSAFAAVPLLFACLMLPDRSQAEDPHNVQTMAAAEEVSRESLANRSLEVKGDVSMARGNYAAALDAYQHLWPQTAVTLNKTGTAYHHLFAVDMAFRNYELAIKLDPRYAPAYNNLGAIYHGRQAFSLAEKAYKQALKYKPQDAVTYSNLGTTYFAEGKFKKGAKAYAKAMEIDPQVFSADGRNKVDAGASRAQRMAASFYLAEVYAGAGKTSEALESLRKAFSEGFHDRKRLMEDKELASLRTTPEFHAMMVDEHLE